MKKLAKQYKKFQYSTFIKESPILLFYKLNHLNLKDFFFLKLIFKEKKINYLHINANLVKKFINSKVFCNFITGNLLIVFPITKQNFKFLTIKSAIKNNLIGVKINNKFYVTDNSNYLLDNLTNRYNLLIFLKQKYLKRLMTLLNASK